MCGPEQSDSSEISLPQTVKPEMLTTFSLQRLVDRTREMYIGFRSAVVSE